MHLYCCSANPCGQYSLVAEGRSFGFGCAPRAANRQRRGAQVDRLMAEKREMFERAQRERAAWDAEQVARQERELGLVERERRRLLRDAADLLDYLPKGVLRTREDLDYVLGLARELKEKGRL